MPATEPNDANAEAERALRAALGALLEPLAALCVARGLPFAAAEELLKRAFVQAAERAHPGLLPHRKVSRIATVTGINRREVSRLAQAVPDDAPPARSPATEVFARWITDRSLRRGDGQPRPLPRQGPPPSFESLAQQVTRDVHPRSLLDELLRLNLARLTDDDQVVLERDAFVPRGDLVRMLGFVGDNVGDHLAAAVENVLSGGRRHFEQAVFAHGLPATALPELRERLRARWQALLDELVPRLQAAVGSAPPEAPTQRLRVGLYTYDDGATDAPPPTPPARRTRRRTAQG